MAAEREQRYEIKLPFHALQLPWLQAAVRAHPAGFREAHPPRQVNNVYLDTIGFACYHDNRAGLSDRDKVRIRWYGASDAEVPAAFEVKRRRRSLNAKLRHRLPAGLDLTSGRSWTEILRDVRRELPIELLAASGNAWHPVVVNRYRREYYATSDGEIRVTIDYDQAFYSQALSLGPNLDRPLPPPFIAVLEVKAPIAAVDRLLAVTSQLPARVRSNSKYAIAVTRALEH